MIRFSVKAPYSVPRRFGIAAMLAFTTLFAVLLGILRFHSAPIAVYLFFGVLGSTVCFAQMWSEGVPRLVSIMAGAICAPLFLLIDSLTGGSHFMPAIVATPCLAVAGGFVGYLMGTISAGVFLVSDLVERRWRGIDAATAADEEAELPPGTPVYTSDSCAPYLSPEAAQVAAGEASMDGNISGDPRVKKLGPPVGVPVYNCVALIASRGADGLVHARAANIAELRTSGASEREALQHLVGAFKIIVSQSLAEGREVPILAEPQDPQPGETQRLIAVHL